MMDERPIPFHLEAEKSVLGAILKRSDALDLVAAILQPQSFHRKAHQQIYAAMLELASVRSGIDFVTLKEKLAQRGELEAVGGPAYLSALTDGLPLESHVEYHAQIVREKAALRRCLAIGSALIAAASAQEEAALDVIAAADNALMQIAADQVSGDLTPASTLMHALVPVLDKAYANKRAITGLQTAWRDLDELTLGLHPGTLTYLAGYTSQGKSSLGLNLAVDIARQGHTAAVFSMEDAKDQVALRAVAAQSGVSLYKMRSGFISDGDWPAIGRAVTTIGSTKLWVDDTSRLSVQELRAKCRRLQSAHALDLVLVDYVQLMYAPGKHENRTREIGVISSGLKQIAKELRVPVIACSQLSRENVKEVRRPRLSDLRDSGNLEQDADVVLLIYRPEQHDPQPHNEGLAELIVAKQRNGPTGTVKLRFEKQTFRFHTWTEAGVPEQRDFYR